MAVMVVTLPVNGRHFGRESLLEKVKKILNSSSLTNLPFRLVDRLWAGLA